MMRPFTCLCLVAAFGSGLYLYSEKHRAEMLDRKIARVMHETEAARQRIGLLRADWALLNDPTRLADMSDKYLALKPMAPGQFVQLADLSNRLPAPQVPPPAGATDEAAPDDAAPVADAAPGADGTQGAPAVEAVPAPPPAPKLAAKAPPAKAAPRLVAHAAPKKAPHAVAVADRDVPLPHGQMAPSSPLPLASPLPLGAHVVSAMAHPTRLAGRATVASATTQNAAYVGSALGGRTSLPPPVPLGPQ